MRRSGVRLPWAAPFSFSNAPITSSTSTSLKGRRPLLDRLAGSRGAKFAVERKDNPLQSDLRPARPPALQGFDVATSMAQNSRFSFRGPSALRGFPSKKRAAPGQLFAPGRSKSPRTKAARNLLCPVTSGFHPLWRRSRFPKGCNKTQRAYKRSTFNGRPKRLRPCFSAGPLL